MSGASGGGTTAPASSKENAMPRPNPTRPYNVPGFRVALVREPGVKLAERPSLRTPAEAARMRAEYIGETDREQFVVALLTVRHRLIGLHTVSVGSLTSSLVHPRNASRRQSSPRPPLWSCAIRILRAIPSRALRTWP